MSASRTAALAPAQDTIPPDPRNPSDGRVFLLDVPFHQQKTAQQAGAQHDENLRCWAWRGSILPQSLVPFRPPPLSYERYREDDINGARWAPGIPRENIVLREHQADGVSAILAARRAGRCGMLLADDVGLGKTYTAWKAVAAMPGIQTVLVVCPLAVTAHWRRSILALGDHGKRVIVLNYDRLSRLFELPTVADQQPQQKKDGAKNRTKKPVVARKPTLKGISRTGRPMRFDAIIWDEAHRLKNPSSARSRLAARLTAGASFNLWLTATAGCSPLDLAYLGRLLAQVTGDKVSDLKDFESWCRDKKLGVRRGAYGQWIWEGGEREIATVNHLLFGGRLPAGLRRRPEDIAGWPEIQRIPAPMELHPDAFDLYEEAWQEFRRVLLLDPKGSDGPNALVARLRFRQKASLLRVPATAELVRDLREAGRRVAVSVQFIETLEALRSSLEQDGLRCVCLHGDMSPEAREDSRIAFQKDQADVCLLTITEGISLHQDADNRDGRAMVIHDIRYSALEMAQIEGRTHRDGRHAPAYWSLAIGTVEERVAEIVTGKMSAMKGMIGDDRETLRAVEAALTEAALAA